MRPAILRPGRVFTWACPVEPPSRFTMEPCDFGPPLKW